MTNEEKRVHNRADCICAAEITADGKKETVSVVDLAAGGVQFRAGKDNTPYEHGGVYHMDLAISENGFDISLSTEVKIHRVAPDSEGGFSYGASFEETDIEQSLLIDEFILYKKKMKS